MKMCLLAAVLSFFCLSAGSAVCRILYGKSENGLYWEDAFLTGVMVFIGLGEAVHLAMLLLDRSPAWGTVCLETSAGALLVLSVTVNLFLGFRRGKSPTVDFGKRKSDPQKSSAGETVLWGIFLLLVLYQVLVIFAGNRVYLSSDMTVETVQTFIKDGALYRTDPLTGLPYRIGVPLRLRILGLPGIYAMLSLAAGVPPVELLLTGVPLWTVFCSILAFRQAAKSLFGLSRKTILVFMILAEGVLCAGAYLYGNDGFGLLGCGFSGTTLRAVVLLPCAFGFALRKKWKLAVLCILAEACVVWTLYGLGACVVVTAGIGLLWRVLAERKAKKGLAVVSGKKETTDNG